MAQKQAAGANPLLPQEFVGDHGLSYHLADWSREELDKAGEAYVTHVVDVQQELMVSGFNSTS